MKDSFNSSRPSGKELIIATTNPDKFAEICSELSSLEIQLRSLKDFPKLPEAPETGATFEENARLKAGFYYRQLHLPVLAEDSGLVIPALGGFPGIHSARIAQDDASRIQCVLDRLLDLEKELPASDSPAPEIIRSAYYVSILAFANGENIHVVEGRCHGTILRAPSGNQGFGYDPIFCPDQSLKTFGQMDRKEKFVLSHRGNSLRSMIPYLQNQFSNEPKPDENGTKQG
jgi:XTP/dITP diphosphohydrolase